MLPDPVPKRKPCKTRTTRPTSNRPQGQPESQKTKTCAMRATGATRARHHGGGKGDTGTRRTRGPSSYSGSDTKNPKTAQKEPRQWIRQPQKPREPTLPHAGHGGRATAPRAIAKGIYNHPKLIVIEKTIAAHLLAAPNIRAQLRQKNTLFEGRADQPALNTKDGVRILRGLGSLLNYYLPTIFVMGHLVRNCTWAGGADGKGIVAMCTSALCGSTC